MSDSQPAAGPDMEILYKGFFEYLSLPALILNAGMEVLDVNHKFLEHFGYTRDQVMGQKCFQVFHRRETPCPDHRCRFQNVLDGERTCVNLNEYLNQEGEVVFEEVHLSAIRDHQGELLGVLEFVNDVSAAKRQEGSLMEANEFLNRLLDSMVGVVVAADLDGRIIFLNRSVERVLGYEVWELVGKHLSKIVPLEELKRATQILKKHGKALGIHTKVLKKDGEAIPVRANSAYVYRKDQPAATVTIFTDLREKLRLEDRLVEARMQVVQSDKLAGLGRMAAGIAHEINNPLTGIMVYADLLRDQLPEGDPTRADLDCILEDAERCQDIVKGLLDYSRQSEVQIEELDLNQIIDDAFNLIRDDSVFLKMRIDRNFHFGPLPIQGDPKLLRQVFINLIMNAVDAMEGQGRLKVTTGIDEQGWRFAEVCDSGPGISPEDLERIFDPFYTTKGVGKGTGLGLSVVYGVLNSHGGSISIKETSSAGTTFLVRLPAEAPAHMVDIVHTFNHENHVEEEMEVEEIK